MGALAEALVGLGYGNVRTLLASGNVVFETKTQKTLPLERAIEAALTKTLGLETDVMVRSPAEWDAIIAANPFVAEADAHPERLLMVALKEKPGAEALRAFAAYLAGYGGPERVEPRGREVFAFYPDGQGRSKLSLETLGAGTGRNWNTVRKLRDLLGA
jgi:uncharacterized protein (DUF1697 family)